MNGIVLPTWILLPKTPMTGNVKHTTKIKMVMTGQKMQMALFYQQKNTITENTTTKKKTTLLPTLITITNTITITNMNFPF